MSRIPLKDIKTVLFAGYIFFYLLAISGPIFIDPQLKSHVLFHSRAYPYEGFCLLILTILAVWEFLFLKSAQTARRLYGSIGVFLICASATLPFFLPEFPHGNIVSVAAGAAIFSAITIFVWWTGTQIVPMDEEPSAGRETIEYIKASLAFIRQATFASVALFGTLFFAAYTTGFKYVESTVDPTAAGEVLLLKANIGFQIAFYGIYSLIGMMRYFFVMTLETLKQFRQIATRSDKEAARRAELETGRPAKLGKPSGSDDEGEELQPA